MTLVAITPTPLWTAYGFVTVPGNVLLDANDEKFAMILQAPKTGTIDRVLFFIRTVTLGETVDVRLETLGADGNPSGTLWGANTNASQVILATDDNTWFEVTLTAGASVARGDIFAVVIAFPSVATGNLNIGRQAGNQGITSVTFSITASFAAAAWTKSSSSPIGGVRYNDATWAALPRVIPAEPSNNSFNSTSTPNERGNKITVPFDCKVSGVWYARDGAGAGDVTYKLYNSVDGLLASKAVDGDLLALGANGKNGFILFDTEVTLNAGDVVRATVLPTIATNTSLSVLTANNAAYTTAMPGGGNVVGTTRTDAGAWTDTAATEHTIGLILSAIDDGAGGGGSSPVSYAFVG